MEFNAPGTSAAGRCVSGEVVGRAALSRVSTRKVYSGVAEVSVYVSAESRGLGIGRLLLERLISESEKLAIWTLQASIFPENRASVSLHRALGFREVGTRQHIGKMLGIWRNTVLFERRSEVAGVD
jgi:L-amino acid N-acyltransferase YncA